MMKFKDLKVGDRFRKPGTTGILEKTKRHPYSGKGGFAHHVEPKTGIRGRHVNENDEVERIEGTTLSA